jgi:hypothetical protein
MKKIALTVVLSALVSCYIGYVIGKSNTYPAYVGCSRVHQNFIPDGRIVIIPVDTMDDRPTYNVLFNDEDGMDSMYPEEIAIGLATGNWDYNEDLQIK